MFEGDTVDFKKPDISLIASRRAKRLAAIRADKGLLAACRIYYRDHPACFINDFGVTADPRHASSNRPVVVPFILFPKQRELVDWMYQRWLSGEPGIIVKSRDVGASWLMMSLQCTLSIFRDNFMGGVGSAKEDKLDRGGDPDTLFAKARQFISFLPVEFRAGFELAKHSAHMRLIFPATGSSITGEAGDNIGRGGRKAMYAMDESAHLERPQLVDMSLASNTNCRIDLSSVNGMANSFYERAHNPAIPRFDITWRDDPRKDDVWYAKKQRELDSVVLAQEIDCSFAASQEGTIIPSLWVQSSVDAHKKLGISPAGAKRAALDIGDTRDKNAFTASHGIHVFHAESWSGSDSDLYATAEKAFYLCDTNGLDGFTYDADGMGASMKGDARKVNEARHKNKKQAIAYRGSDAVIDPERKVPGTERTALDFFQNRKAQSWWNLRRRFEGTYRAVSGEKYDPEEIVSLDSKIAELSRLTIELSQPVWKTSQNGKLMVDKVPEGATSPNLADSLCMLLAPYRKPMQINAAALELMSQH